MIARGHNIDDMYLLPKFGATALAEIHTITAGWHHRLGHPSTAVLNYILHFVPSSTKDAGFCFTCALNKCHRLPFSSVTHNSKRPSELLHLDLWCPAPEKSREGYFYYLGVVDDFS